ncbi:hypothetical protein PHLCEN_2v13079 [Hermanssonia centrifuga]|uniref:Uncharacterized protein n=1 Tax=Hermanssonia centrifuga TaxID=98765 RepID=A0A2R6NFD7_9APHY|nr:hypothetical protein PHLCEN_2v13079 [Hermanssonia centrifuga]
MAYPRPIVPCGSDTSLKLNDPKYDSGSLLATSLTFDSSLDSTHSLTEIPPFPAHISRPIFVNLLTLPVFSSRIFEASSTLYTVTVPTSPRLKSLLMEPISVANWTKNICSEPQVAAWESELISDKVSKPWVPEGSIVPPEFFRAIFRPQRVVDESLVFPTEVKQDSTEFSLCVDASYTPGSDHEQEDQLIVYPGDEDCGARALTVPTIMLSNSTAAVPLSLESSQSLAPLAVRRGLKAPKPLVLNGPKASEHDLYPGIPSPFLGSPSTYTPTFETSRHTVDMGLDLATMCRDLRSRCPPLRVESPGTPSLEDPSSMISNASVESGEGDDWTFAYPILEQFSAEPNFDVATACSKSNFDVEVPAIVNFTREPEPFSWTTERTLVEFSGPPLQSLPEVPAECQSTPADPKQKRRRTVIIETPRNSVIEGSRPTRITIDLSHLGDDASLSHASDQYIPFETPRHQSCSSDVFDESAPRPASSATMKVPVRGILKEKKSVRFSDVNQEQEPQESQIGVFGRKRSSTTPGCRPQSPHLKSAAIEKNANAKQNRSSFPKHPAVRSFVRSSTPSPLAGTPTPAPRTSQDRRSLQYALVPRSVEIAEVGRPRKLARTAAGSYLPPPAKNGNLKKGINDENAVRRESVAEKWQSLPRSGMAMPNKFRSMLTRFRT